MNVFQGYARYYDLLYRDKDYSREAEFVHKLIQKHAPNGRSILELGCGTGNHAMVLVRRGYDVHGIDASPSMLRFAEARLRQMRPEDAARISFEEGDLRNVDVGRQFDAVILLFHVMSYQTANDDLNAAFMTIRKHLKPNGVFIFDCWHGPGVLTDQPAVRVKRFEDDAVKVTRIAEPVMYPAENLVEVQYEILVREKATSQTEVFTEMHRMRYLFQPEIDMFCRENRLELIEAGEWMTGKRLRMSSWNAYFAGRSV